MRIFLIGFMGVGKTYLGKILAERLGFAFLDLDEAITAQSGLAVPEIFEQFGEEQFRRLERQVLRETSSKTAFVISTGGGTPCFFDNMEWMNANGLTVYLSADPTLLAQRLVAEKAKRPLIAGLDEAALEEFVRAKIVERQPFYGLCHLELVIDKDGDDAIVALASYLTRFFCR